LGKGRPSYKILLSLVAIVCGAVAYVWIDSEFTISKRKIFSFGTSSTDNIDNNGLSSSEPDKLSLKITSYFWVSAYFVCQCVDVLYIKYVVDKVPMSNWGRSYYNNLLALPALFIGFFFTTEMSYLRELWDLIGIDNEKLLVILVLILLSSALGLFLSIAGFVCRACVSATSFSVVGNMNKFLTVLILLSLYWQFPSMFSEKHASSYGLMALFASLISGAFYSKFVTEQQQQNDPNVAIKKEAHENIEHEEEMQERGKEFQPIDMPPEDGNEEHDIDNVEEETGDNEGGKLLPQKKNKSPKQTKSTTLFGSVEKMD